MPKNFNAFALVTALSLVLTLPASAGSSTDGSAGASVQSDANIGADVDRAWDKTKAAVSKAADKVSTAAENAYYDLRDLFRGGDKTEIRARAPVTIHAENMASGLIGKDVRDTTGSKVAKIEDVILDQSGAAQMIVMRDGGLFGMGGKLVAMDYASIVTDNGAALQIHPVSDEMVKSAAKFDYKPGDGDTRVIPSGGVSVAKLIDSKVLDSAGKAVAEIENVAFANGKAQDVIVSFDEILEMGGQHAAMSYGDIRKVTADGKTQLQLTEEQSRIFADFKAKARASKS